MLMNQSGTDVRYAEYAQCSSKSNQKRTKENDGINLLIP
jgi:hypothetical protein